MTEIMNNNLIIGLGGTGGRVLKELRKRIYDEHDEIAKGIGFMYVDSSRELMQPDDPTWQTPDGKSAQFFVGEFLDISLNSLVAFPTPFPHLKGIIENWERPKNYQPRTGTMQDRRFGRILLGLHATEFDRLLRDRVLNLQKQTGKSVLNITIVTGLSGGTGSGCVISVIAYILRLYPDAIISVMATLPTIPPPPMHDTGRHLANAYAALRELNALNIGKLKLTDLVTGEKFQPELPYDRSLDFCHRLQENKLFKLFLFDSFYNEYGKIANILYHNMWLGTGNSAVETYKRYLEMYATIPAPEFNASTEEGEYTEARTRAVGALGLYRIVYPRKQILHYLAQSATSQAIWQMLYNNYDGGGYIEKVAEFEPRAICRLNIEKWHLDLENLTLQCPILEEENKSVMSFGDVWFKAVSFYGDYNLAKEEAEKVAYYTNFHYVSAFASEVIYDKRFRSVGVKDYFSMKTSEVDKYAHEIIANIEQDLYEKWTVGEYGLYQLLKIYDAIKDCLQEQSDKLPQYSDNLSQKIEAEERDINYILEEVGRMTRLQIRLKELTGEMQKKYKRFCGTLVSYYSARTALVSLDFTKELLRTLLQELDSTKNCLDSVIHILKRMDENALRKANDLLTQSNHPDFNKNIIDLSNRQDVDNYKKFMLADKKFMLGLAGQVRTFLTSDTEHSFTLLSNKWEYSKTADLLQQNLMETITANDENNSIAEHIQDYLLHLYRHFSLYCNSGKTPENFIEDYYQGESQTTSVANLDKLREAIDAYYELLNVPYVLRTNILREMDIQFSTTDSLTSNIRQVLQKACDNIQLNDCETMKVVRNNPLPNDPWLRPHETILVRIPHATNERERLTSERLAALFKANCGFTNVIIDTEAPETQEISIASIRTNFPLRCVKSLPDLKQQYDDLISNRGTQAVNMLHTEDAFENLPSLEIEAYTAQQPLSS